ncbi:MAG: ribosomal RNA small subunit methyltransferase A [Rhodothalassiaceae bacterium]|nr:MAG: ribosomal RNA small subunit methyltransferase A [Rhodothalassiaceae bacterium]
MSGEGPGDGLPPLREVVTALGLSARKALGQHFLFDLNLTRRIARAAGPFGPDDVVFEVGPGPGGLTRALLMEGAPFVFAVERDRRMVPALDAIAARWPGRFAYRIADARGIDLKAEFGPRPVRVVANLPYNVGTHLLLGWLGEEPWPPSWVSLTLMFQKEVAARLTAAPGSADYGALSVLARWRASVRRVMTVPARAFVPPPKVDSAVVRITPATAPVPDLRLRDLDRLLRPLFAGRRKMLRRSLKGLVADPSAFLARAGVPGTARPEDLDVATLVRLAALLRVETGSRGPGRACDKD